MDKKEKLTPCGIVETVYLCEQCQGYHEKDRCEEKDARLVTGN